MSAETDIGTLKERAKVLRRHIIEMTTAAGSGHPSSSLSAVEIVTALFFGGILRVRPNEPDWPDRDRFILSKGHAVPVLYAAMVETGFFSTGELTSLRKLGSVLEGHPNMRRLPGIEASTGSLGQGLSIAVGHAFACRLDGRPSRVYCMLGDGEMGEGQVWEAIASADKYKLANLTAIVDQNGFQQTGSTETVLDMGSLADKFSAFGWHTQVINGNDQGAALEALNKAMTISDRPQAIISQTQKGFGILPVLESQGDLNFHGKPLPPDLAREALELLA